jgi:hypothetical protein
VPDATGLHHVRWRKKKVNGFIIPANYFYGRVYQIPVESPEIIEAKVEEPAIPAAEPTHSVAPETIEPENPVTEVKENQPSQQPVIPQATTSEVKVSALSLKSIRAKKELELNAKPAAKDEAHLPVEEFNETDMLLQWTKFAQRLSDRGHKIMESLLLINDPKLQGTTIIHELPNEGSKIDFEAGKHELIGYLRGKLHNHDIEIKIVVNESMDNRKAFTPQDRYNRLNEINPSLELLRKTFDLDF